jgi:hypothetical protein
MEKELKEMQKILEEISSDLISISSQTEKSKKFRQERTEEKDIGSIIKSECAEIKNMIRAIDNRVIADSVSRMVVNQMMAPLQDAIASAVKDPGKPHAIGKIAEDMRRKVERLSDRHIRVIKCLSRANGEWVNYDSLSSVCRLSQSCLRGYVSDLKRVYEIPIETSKKEGRMHIRIDPQTVKKLALGYQAAKIDPA